MVNNSESVLAQAITRSYNATEARCAPVRFAFRLSTMVKVMKKKAATGTRKGHTKTPVWTKMSKEEMRLMRMWYKEDDKTPTEIAKLLHRSKSSVTRHLFIKSVPDTQGPKSKLTETQIKSLVTKTRQYIKQAAGRYRITYDITYHLVS